MGRFFGINPLACYPSKTRKTKLHYFNLFGKTYHILGQTDQNVYFISNQTVEKPYPLVSYILM